VFLSEREKGFAAYKAIGRAPLTLTSGNFPSRAHYTFDWPKSPTELTALLARSPFCSQYPKRKEFINVSRQKIIKTKNKSSNMEVIFFQSRPCLTVHVHMLQTQTEIYLSTLRFICKSGTTAIVSTGVKTRVLAALHITQQHKMVAYFLQQCEIVDVSKALKMLDRNRKIRQLGDPIDSIEMAHPHVNTKADSEKRDGAESSMSKARRGQRAKDNIEVPQRKRRRKVDTYRLEKKTLESEDSCPGTGLCAAAHADTSNLELIQSSSVSVRWQEWFDNGPKPTCEATS